MTGNPNHDEKGKFSSSSRSRAAAGGEHADSNGYFYKGGQFLPSSDNPPGTFKVDGKVLKTGRAQVEPGKWEVQPTPFSRPIFELIGGHTISSDDSLKLREGIRDYNGDPISMDTEIRPGVKGILSKEAFTMGEMIGAYNNGMRWIDVKPLSLSDNKLDDATWSKVYDRQYKK